MRPALVTTALLAAGLLACSNFGGQPQSVSAPTSNHPRKNVTVQFTNASVHPSIARVLPGGNVAWVNYAGYMIGTVVFPDSIKAAFTCTSLRPMFSKVAAGYQSIPITGAGGESVTLPCPLKPGTYEYQIYLSSGGDATAGGLSNPDLTLPAKIVVQ